MTVIDYDPNDGDLLGFIGPLLSPASGVIRTVTFSKWSHIAAIAKVTQRDLEKLFKRSRWLVHPTYFMAGKEWVDQFQVIESTTLATEPCNIRGLPMRGVQAHNPITRIKRYEGEVWLLRRNPDFEYRWAAAGGSEAWTEDLLSHFGSRYDTFGAALSGSRWLKMLLSFRAADRSTVFCSEIVRRSLQRMNLVNLGNSGMVTPGGLIDDLLESGAYFKDSRLK